MIEEYERRYDEHQGLLLGSVTTAVPLSDEQRIQLERMLQNNGLSIS